MNSTASAKERTFDYAWLVQSDRVHGSLYTDQTIFNDEMERIFYQGWVYIGHASEVAQPGSYCTKMLGLQSVILTRDTENQIHVLFDRCSHRGNKVCQTESGVTRQLVCPYHGWSFALDGRLKGVPALRGFGSDFDQSATGLVRLPRIDSYGGFVFASMSPTGISLNEHLGKAKDMIDQLVKLSPVGEIKLTSGWMKHRFQGNWKNVVENQVDGYHAPFVHGSLFQAKENWAAERDRRDISQARTRDLGMGHSDVDHSLSYRGRGGTLRWTGNIPESRLPMYVTAMRAAYSDEEATLRLTDGPPHAAIFPNLFIAEMNIMVVQPVSAGVTVHHTTPVLLEEGHELNARSLRRCEGALGPAGFLISDDAEVSQLNQIGLNNRQPEWLLLGRGLHDEIVEEDGVRIGGLMDETSQRAFWKQYRQIMTGEQ